VRRKKARDGTRNVMMFPSPVQSSRLSSELSDSLDRSINQRDYIHTRYCVNESPAHLAAGSSTVLDTSQEERLGQYIILCIELFNFYKQRTTAEKEEMIAA
jgi:hypothetical protein